MGIIDHQIFSYEYKVIYINILLDNKTAKNFVELSKFLGGIKWS
jgi:hypothetical protein